MRFKGFKTLRLRFNKHQLLKKLNQNFNWDFEYKPVTKGKEKNKKTKSNSISHL